MILQGHSETSFYFLRVLWNTLFFFNTYIMVLCKMPSLTSTFHILADNSGCSVLQTKIQFLCGIFLNWSLVSDEFWRAGFQKLHLSCYTDAFVPPSRCSLVSFWEHELIYSRKLGYTTIYVYDMRGEDRMHVICWKGKGLCLLASPSHSWYHPSPVSTLVSSTLRYTVCILASHEHGSDRLIFGCFSPIDGNELFTRPICTYPRKGCTYFILGAVCLLRSLNTGRYSPPWCWRNVFFLAQLEKRILESKYLPGHST